jgi:hypothetical protein
LAKIAAQDGEPLPDSESETEEDASDEEHRHYELASKFIRFFTHNDTDFFYFFIECGVKRKFTVRPVFDHTQIEFSIKIPIPEDELFHSVGIQHATEVEVEETEELIYITPPRKLSPKAAIKSYYPNQETPLYVIYKYEMEIPKEIAEDVVSIDLTNMFAAKKATQ